MRKSLALILLTVVSPTLLLAMLVDMVCLRWLVAPMICALPVLLIAVAAKKTGRRPWGLWVLWLLLAGSWSGLLWLSSSRSFEHPSVEDVKQVLVLMLVGLGLMPLALTAWLYARDFLAAGLTPDELRRLREHRQR